MNASQHILWIDGIGTGKFTSQFVNIDNCGTNYALVRLNGMEWNEMQFTPNHIFQVKM